MKLHTPNMTEEKLLNAYAIAPTIEERHTYAWDKLREETHKLYAALPLDLRVRFVSGQPYAGHRPQCYSLLMFTRFRHSLTLPLALVWWFAVLSPSGEIVFSEHRNKEACETTRKAYARVPHLTVTTCQNNQQTTKETRHGWKS